MVQGFQHTHTPHSPPPLSHTHTLAEKGEGEGLDAETGEKGVGVGVELSSKQRNTEKRQALYLRLLTEEGTYAQSLGPREKTTLVYGQAGRY